MLNRKSTFKLAIAAGLATSAAAHAQIANGDFEAGVFAPAWTQFGDTSFTAVAAGNFAGTTPHGGTYAAHFGPTVGTGGISQVVPANAGDSVTVSFWYQAQGDENSFSADLGSTNLISFTNDLDHTAWTFFTFTVTAPTADPVLSFTMFNPPSYDFLDDITAVGGVTGACCLGAPTYSCIVTNASGCSTAGGTYAGNNVTCAAANCPPAPTGACCNPALGCTITSELACTNGGGTYAGNNVTCAAANCPPISAWQENGDAGDLPATAQITGGSGSMTQIRGSFTASDVDMYQINICDAANWSATTVGGSTLDTQLWLFKADGTGVCCDDDSAGGLQSTLSNIAVAPLGNGLYYLAISVFNRDAAGASTNGLIWNSNVQDATPDGPAAAEPVGNWLNATNGTGPYAIALTGTCFVGGNFGACCLGAPSYSCSVQSPAACASAGGTYAGNNVTCAAANCPPPPTGACCAPDGTCSVVTQAACTIAGGVYGGNNVTCAAAGCVNRIYTEVGDAGDVAGTAQPVTGGSGNVLRINGTIDPSDADLFKINICNRATFNATTVGNGNTLDTQLWLFDTAGVGLAMDDDTQAGGIGGSIVTGQFIPANGEYLLGISTYNRDAIDASAQFLFTNNNPNTGLFYPEWQPTGPGAANPVAAWQDVNAPTSGAYSIALTGACFVGGCYANCDGSTAVPLLTANDFQCFLNKYAAQDPYANCDGSTANPILTANDFQCFLNKYAVGCT